MQIFLSYRRGDAGGYAGRLYDALVQRLGVKSVFQDITAIAPGENFSVVIDRALDQCDAVLAVVGPAWLSASTPEGARRLWEEDDYVRLELARALARDVPVVPVLVGGASLPTADDLPASLSALAQRQAVVLRDETWQGDVETLVRRLRGEPAEPTARRRRFARGGVGALLVATIAGGGWWLLANGEGEDGGRGGDSEVVKPCAPPTGEGWTSLPLNQDPVGEEREDGGSLVYRVREARRRLLGPGRWQVILTTSMENRTGEVRVHGDWRYDFLVVGQRAFEPTCFSPNPELVAPRTVGDALIGFETSCDPSGYIELVGAEAQARIRVTDAHEPAAC